MKTLKDLECTIPCLDEVMHPQQKFTLMHMLRDAAKEWIKEIDEITNNYVENGGNLSDDEVMLIFKKQHPEWYPQLIEDWSDDDLSRFYFLQNFLNYFFNLGVYK